MKHEDKQAFAQMLTMVGEYYGREVTKGLMSMYWQGLQHLDLSAVNQALNDHMRNPDTGQFMPKIADITRMLSGTTQDAALLAWAKVDKALRRIGPHQDVVFDDPAIHRVITDMGGWIGLGTKTEDEWPFIAKEFDNRYRGITRNSSKFDYLPKLTGSYNLANERHGQPLAEPYLIGEPQKCLSVMQGGSSNQITFQPMGQVADTQLRLVTSPTSGKV